LPLRLGSIQSFAFYVLTFHAGITVIYLLSLLFNQSAYVFEKRLKGKKGNLNEQILLETASITGIGILNVKISISFSMLSTCDSMCLQFNM